MVEVLIVGYVVIGIAIVLVQLAVFNYQATQFGKIIRSCEPCDDCLACGFSPINTDFFQCSWIEQKVIVAIASVAIVIIWPYALFKTLQWMMGEGDWE